MKTVLAIVFACLFALWFERARIARFLGQRRAHAFGRAPHQWHAELMALRRQIEEEQGLAHLAFAEPVDGETWRFLLAWNFGDLFLRASGDRVRYRLIVHNRTEPAWIERAAPVAYQQEHGPHRPGWVFRDPAEGWATIDSPAELETVTRLFDAFRAHWARHLDPGLKDRRRAAWAATGKAVVPAELERLLTILGRGDAKGAKAGLAAARRCWRETPWTAVPDDADARTLLWWAEAVDPVAERMTRFDWKGYEPEEQEALFAGRPGLGDIAVPEGDMPARLAALDAALIPRGYRLLVPPTPDDSYLAVVVTEAEAGEASALAGNMGVRLDRFE